MAERKKSDRTKKEPAETAGSRRLPRVLPLLALRDNVYFPHMLFPLFVGRDKSVRSLDEAMARNRYIQAIQEYNVIARSFPTNLTAMVFGYQAKPSFTVANEAQISTLPTVDFKK